jgi:hypothetical protein
MTMPHASPNINTAPPLWILCAGLVERCGVRATLCRARIAAAGNRINLKPMAAYFSA